MKQDCTAEILTDSMPIFARTFSVKKGGEKLPIMSLTVSGLNGVHVPAIKVTKKIVSMSVIHFFFVLSIFIRLSK